MEQLTAEGIIGHFTEIEDPREARGKRHLLVDILCIAILAVICDANDYEEIEGYGLAKQEWLSGFLELPHGVPSAATFRRVFAAINPEAWQACFVNWVRSLALEDDEMSEEVLAADGKTARGSRDGELGALHTVSVWASQQGIVVGQAQVEAHSNEITALPELIESLDVAGAVLTTDAMGTQKQVAWAAREHHAHYMLALKANHPKLHQDVMWLFEDAERHDWHDVPHDYYETLDNAHGRQERRRYWVLDDLSVLDPGEVKSWRDLRSVVCVESRRTLKGQTSVEKPLLPSELAL